MALVVATGDPARADSERANTAAASTTSPGVSWPGPDMDGDGLDDVVVTEWRGSAMFAACRSGRDGHELASYLNPRASLDYPADGTYQRVLVAESPEPVPGSPGQQQVTLTWYDRCRKQWSRTFTASDDSATAIFVRGILHGRGAPRVLVETSTHVPAGTDVTVELLSTVDGRTVFAAPPARFIDEAVQATPLPDVTGDGDDDFAYVRAPLTRLTPEQEHDRLDAYASSDGRAVWSASVPSVRSHRVASAGDANADGTDDVLVSSHIGPPDPSALVDGASGDTVWQLEGQDPLRLTTSPAPALFGLYQVYLVGDDVVADALGVDAAGHIRYRARIGAAPREGGRGAEVRSRRLGDVDGDAVEDVAYEFRVYYDGDTPDGPLELRKWSTVVSGRTGATRRADVRPVISYQAAMGTGAFDGVDDDVWDPAPEAPVVRDWRSRRVLTRWSAERPVEQVQTFDSDGDSCPDLLVLAGDDDSRLYAVSGATGAVQWSVPPTGAPAKVISAAAPQCRQRAGSRGTAAPRPTGGMRIPATGGPPMWPAAAALAAAAALTRRRRGA